MSLLIDFGNFMKLYWLPLVIFFVWLFGSLKLMWGNTKKIRFIGGIIFIVGTVLIALFSGWLVWQGNK